MSYKVISIPKFERELKRLVKKYPSLKQEYMGLVSSLKENPAQGTQLGNNCFKIRIPIASKGRGKSGGARVITCFRIIEGAVYLLTIFDKSEQENISDVDLSALLKWIPK